MKILQYRIVYNLTRVAELWERCGRDSQSDTVHFGDPQWLLECFYDDRRQLEVCFVEHEGAIVGVAPFAVQSIPLKFQIGPVALGTMGLRRLRLLGGAPKFPDEAAAVDALFRELLQRRDFDVIWIETLRADSFIWSHLRTSPLVRQHFQLYRARGPVARPYINLRGSFKEYMGKFSPKTRETWRRRVKKLRTLGALDVARVSGVDDVESFVAIATKISRTTYQFRRLGLGLRDDDGIQRRLRLAAERGWLRSYLLSCGGKACCFMVGYQFRGRFYYADVGYDPAWRKWSVGTVLLLHVIEDLFSHDRPDTLDFGAGGEYKRHFGNDSYQEVEVFLFRRRVYPLTVAIVQRATDGVGAAIGRATGTLGLKSRLQRWLRGRADRVEEQRPE